MQSLEVDRFSRNPNWATGKQIADDLSEGAPEQKNNVLLQYLGSSLER
jgi:hypothetical protein